MREERIATNLNSNSKARKTKIRRITIENLHMSPPTLKLEKTKKEKVICAYCKKPYHEEHACMSK